MRKCFIKFFSSIFPIRKSHWEADEIRNKTHKIKSRAYGLYWSASLVSNFRSLLLELNSLPGLATELLTKAASCTYDPDVPPCALPSPACHMLLPHLRAHKEVWAAELSPPLITLESSQARVPRPAPQRSQIRICGKGHSQDWEPLQVLLTTTLTEMVPF